MGIHVGGPKAWKVRDIGDIRCAFHWVNGEPCMVLARANSHLMRYAAIVIEQSKAYMLADSKSGDPTMYLIEKAAEYNQILGFEFSKGSVKKIADIIVEGIPDLLHMPPEPTSMQLTGKAEKPIGELKAVIDGKVVYDGEIH